MVFVLPNLPELEDKIGYIFRDKKYLQEAVTFPNNWRLAMVGDDVLDLIVVDHLLCNYPNYDRHEQTLAHDEIVSNSYLVDVAKRMQLASYLISHNSYGIELISDFQRSRLASGVEAVIGAIYRDSGESLEPARKFVVKNVMETAIKNIETTIKKPARPHRAERNNSMPPGW